MSPEYKNWLQRNAKNVLIVVGVVVVVLLIGSFALYSNNIWPFGTEVKKAETSRVMKKSTGTDFSTNTQLSDSLSESSNIPNSEEQSVLYGGNTTPNNLAEIINQVQEIAPPKIKELVNDIIDKTISNQVINLPCTIQFDDSVYTSISFLQANVVAANIKKAKLKSGEFIYFNENKSYYYSFTMKNDIPELKYIKADYSTTRTDTITFTKLIFKTN